MKIISLLIITIIITFSSCSGRDGTFDWTKPHSLDLTPPEGPYEYEEGWSDGCESAMDAYDQGFYKLLDLHEYRQRADLRNNKMYYQAWKDAFLYCAMYLERVINTKI